MRFVVFCTSSSPIHNPTSSCMRLLRLWCFASVVYSVIWEERYSSHLRLRRLPLTIIIKLGRRLNQFRIDKLNQHYVFMLRIFEVPSTWKQWSRICWKKKLRRCQFSRERSEDAPWICIRRCAGGRLPSGNCLQTRGLFRTWQNDREWSGNRRLCQIFPHHRYTSAFISSLHTR